MFKMHTANNLQPLMGGIARNYFKFIVIISGIYCSTLKHHDSTIKVVIVVFQQFHPLRFQQQSSTVFNRHCCNWSAIVRLNRCNGALKNEQT